MGSRLGHCAPSYSRRRVGRIYTAILLLRFILTPAQSGSQNQSQGAFHGEKHSNLLRRHR